MASAGHEADHQGEAAPKKSDRSALRKAAERLGWTWINRGTVAVRCERELRIGGRTVVLQGRVEIALPAELTAAGDATAAGERAAAAVADPAVAELQAALERTAARALREPDDVTETRVFRKPAFLDAVREAERELSLAYRALADRRLDDEVEAQLGIRFYLEALGPRQRTLEYFVGPTNSGKTHAALELLQAAPTGAYLAPLRLLALEVFERLSERGVATSLVTGEERILHPHARHVSSTVEMVDLGREVDVAVVDEAQLLEDAQRGWAWTLAIAGVRARHVVLCGSEEGLRAARRLAERLGLSLAVRRFERKNPLRVTPAITLGALRPGDALVAFSRREVVELQAEVAALGFSSAAVYGSLSPSVRRREAARFRAGEADVLVATDAIGLGLNLPIRRIVFATVEKYDGVQMRALTVPEARQIAGRAGRYGIHEEGLVTALDPADVVLLRRAVEGRQTEHPEGPVWIAPTDEHLARLAQVLGTSRVSRLLRFFQTRVLREPDGAVRIADLSEQIEVAATLETAESFGRLPLAVRSAYSRAPVASRGPSLEVLLLWAQRHARGEPVEGEELMAPGGGRDRTLVHEDQSRTATLYLWLSQRFPNVYTNRESVLLIRETIDDDIQAALLKRGAKRKVRRQKRHPVRALPSRRRG